MNQRDHNFLASRLPIPACLVIWIGCYVFAGTRLQGLLINSVMLAAGTLLICLPLGTLLAVAVAKTDLWGRQWLERVMIVQLFVPLYVQATAWQAAVGQGGYLVSSSMNGNSWLSGWTAAIWIHGMAAVPWVVLFTAATLRKVPRELEEEALQDSSAWKVLIRVSLRQAAVGIAAAALWVSVICFNEIAVTDLFQVRTFAEEIYTAASLGVLDGVQVDQAKTPTGSIVTPQFGAFDLGAGVLAVAILVLVALMAIAKCLSYGNFTSTRSDWSLQIRGGQRVVWCLVWGAAIVAVGIPLLGLIGKAGAQVEQISGQFVRDWSPQKVATLVIASPWQHRREIGWSLAIGSVVTVATVVISIIISWALRTRRLPAKPTAMLLALLLAIPGPLLAIWLIRILNQPDDSWLFPLTWCYDHTILAPVLVQILRALPAATLVLVSQFGKLPQEVIDSSVSEGASWMQQLTKVVLPLHWPAVVVAIGVVMIVSLGELAATLLVVPPGVSPLSVRIFGLIHYGAEDRVSAFCLLLIITLSAGLAIVWQLIRMVVDRKN